MSSKMKGLSPEYIGNNPFIDPTDPLKKQGNGPATLYPVNPVPEDPLRGRLSDVLDYNVAIIATPDTFVGRVNITATGDYPQNATVGLGFTPSSILMRAFQTTGGYGYSEAYIDLTKASIKGGKGVQTYCTYVTGTAIQRAEDTTNAIRVLSSSVVGTVSLIPNGFNINISSWGNTTIVHYIAYQ